MSVSTSTINIVFFLNIILDWERLGPLWFASNKRDDINIKLIATKRFRSRCHSTINNYQDILTSNITLLGLGLFWRPDVIVTATESSASPHRKAHILTKYANTINIPTITMQHGYECVGINYADQVYDYDTSIASRHILIWQDLEALPDEFDSRIGDRALTAGYIALERNAMPEARLEKYLKEVGDNCESKIKHWLLVTENLHWHRYNEDYRKTFQQGILSAATRYPQTGFIIKPHPAGRFLTSLSKDTMPANIFLAEDISIRIPGPEPAIASYLAVTDGLITTPSTTCIDAAIMNKPVLIMRHRLAGNWAYEPLFAISQQDELIRGIGMINNHDEELNGRSAAFLAKNKIRLARPDEVLDQIIKTLGY